MECVEILASLEDKDKFLYWFEKGISKKMLNSNKASNAFWEEWFIKCIKSKLGSEFTKNLETIIREVKKSHEDKLNWEKYLDKLHLPTEARAKIPDMKVIIVPKCDWLVPIKFEIQPTIDIESVQKTYENYFRSKSQNSNKGLDWIYYFGTIECKFKSINTNYFLQCRPYQYFVIKLFEKFSYLKFSDLKKFLMMKDDGYLLSIIQSIIAKNPKKRLLTTDPLIPSEDYKKLKEIITGNPEMKFFVNPQFKSKSKKVILKDAKFES